MPLKRWLTILLPLLLIVNCAQAAGSPAYESTASFLQALQAARLGYELGDVDEDRDEYVGVPCGDTTIHCYLSDDGETAALIVWYLAEYPAEKLDDVLMVCSELNGSVTGVCFYADESDHTVTASVDLLFAPEDAGTVLIAAVEELQGMLPAAHKALAEVLAEPEPTPASSAGKSGKAAATPTPKATRRPTATATPAPAEEGFYVVITAEKAWLYAGPSKASPYVATASKGDRFACIALTRGFYIIDFLGEYVFVSDSMAVRD